VPDSSRRRIPEAEPLLTPAEVAEMFRVDPKTVTRWARAGKLTSIRTPGNHRRFYEAEVRALLAGVREGTCPDCRYDVRARGHAVSCGGGQ